jgi:very-short-patch-repair endonuclease
VKTADLADKLAFHLHAVGVRDFEREYRFHPVRRWRFDIALTRQRIAIECDGGLYINGRHSRGASQEKDYEKHNAAVVLGWRVLKFGPNHIKSGEAVKVVEDAMRAA